MRQTSYRPRGCGYAVRSIGLANLLLLAGILSGAGVFSGCASVGGHEAPAALKISVVPTSLDFKDVVVGQKNTQTLHVTNVSDEPVSFEKLRISGQGFTFSSAKTPLTLPPNASFPVTLTFAPTNTTPVSGSLVVSSSDVKSPVTVPLAGTGAKASPQLEVFPASLSFGSTAVHTAATQSVTLKNTGNVPITIDSVALSSSAYSATGLSSGVSLSPDQALEFKLTFRPTTAGAASATLTVGSAGLKAPARLNLSGSGANPTSSAPNPPTTSAPHPNPSAPSAPSSNPPSTTPPTSSSPPAPTAPTSTTASAPFVALAWNPSTSSIVGYHVYRGATSGGPYTRISSSVINALDYHDDDVQSGSHYVYVVTALDSEGRESAFSNEASASVPNP